ncbi:MAG: DUF2975 domain-containing protein [Alphaproteobacteria bacterium]
MSNLHPNHLRSTPSAFSRRINLVASILQIFAVIWIGVVIWQITAFWSDHAAVVGNFGRRLHVDLSALSSEHYIAAVALVAVDVALTALVALQIGRLASIYRRGEVFTENAAIGLQRLALYGVIALAGDLLARHVVVLVLTAHLANGPIFGGLWITSQDFLYGIMILFIFMLASVFRAAAQMAEEQAAII